MFAPITFREYAHVIRKFAASRSIWIVHCPPFDSKQGIVSVGFINFSGPSILRSFGKMPQGRLRVKARLPENVKKKPVQVAKKGAKRGIKKKKPAAKNKKIQKALETTVRLNVENELREKASSTGQPLSTTSGKKPKASAKARKKKK